MTITKLYFTRSTPAHYVAEITAEDGTAGLYLLPCTVGRADKDMANIRPFKGNAKTLDDVAPHLVMSLAFSGYPVDSAYYEASKAANALQAAR